MFRRFKKRFEYQDADLGKVAIPRGWSGEVGDDVAKAADAAGVTLLERKVEGGKANPPETGEKKPEDMTRDELVALAEGKGLTVKAADTKPEILAAIKAAAA